MKILKIASDQNYLIQNEKVRPHPMLHPLWPNFIEAGSYPWMKKYDRYLEIGENLFEMTPLEDADFAVMPDDWRTVVGQVWYEKCNTKAYSLYKEFAAKAEQAKKPLIVFFGGDRSDEAVKLPNKNMIIFRHSNYRSRAKTNNFSWPEFVEDLVEHYLDNNIVIRQKQPKPTVGFCGLIKPANFKNIIKKYIYYAYMITQKGRWGYPPIQGHFLRDKIIKNFKKSSLVKTNFVIRENMVFLGKQNLDQMQKLRIEFVNNMIDSDYVLCCRGAGNYSNRIFETLCCGRIPILVDTDCVLPYDFAVDWKKYCVWIKENEIPQIAEKVAEFHNNISTQEFIILQQECRKFWKEWLSTEGFYSKFHLHFQSLT
ncbi:exostosin domain-containing protein [Planktothrix agardhii]|uniref:exostosin domain-containing protein n=1 Tax=Planktothrix agardhii TaxID=1160 RepID=UPI0020A6E837|nr:exostosin family protein [Planktothrix agardhii]CAD5978408.1 Exostosin [Planktothrix agardhii]